MRTRIITAIVSLAVFLAVLYAGAVTLRIAIGIVILIMLHELYSAITSSVPLKVTGMLSGIVLMAGIYFDSMFKPAIAVLIMLFMIIMVFQHEKVSYREVLASAMLTVYVVLFMSYIPLLREERGLGYMAFIFLIAWGSDTAAYFCGTFFGKHKLIPKVSPKKTVEGSAGAVVCSALICMLYVFLWGKVYGVGESTYSYLMAALLGAVGSAVSQLGDLTASAIKRDAGIKDYGKIFPGHGGFMDRFDSVLFITPLVYYFITVLL